MKKHPDILAELNSKLDSIPDKHDQVREIVDFTMIYGDSYGPDIFPVIDRGIEMAKQIGYKSGEMICYCNLLFFQGITKGTAQSKYNSNIPELLSMIEILRTDSEWQILGLNQLAFYYWFRGEYEKGFDTIYEALKLSENDTTTAKPWNYFALAVFYFDTKDFENAHLNYQKSFDFFLTLNYEYGMARAKNGLASILIAQNKTAEATPMLEYSASIYRKLGQYSGLSRTLNDMGLLKKTEGLYDEAIPLLNESAELRKEIDHIQGLITTYSELGETYLLKKDYQSALEQFEKGLYHALNSKTKQKQIRLYKLFYDTYKELNNTELALKNLETYYEVKSEILSDEAANNIKRIQTKFEKEKSEKEAEFEKLKNVELKIAHDLIEEKNKSILDSIRYAKRIQNSLLPTEVYIDRQLKRLKK